MNAFLIVGLGGGLGAMARYGVTLASTRMFGPLFPYGTMIVNVGGSFLMGFIAIFLVRHLAVNDMWRLFLLTGLLGGFTTFSAFSLDAFALWERGATMEALIYTIGSVVISLLGLIVGIAVARSLI